MWEKRCHNDLFDHERCAVAMTATEASQLAERAHAGQADKAGRPYVEHVLAVCGPMVVRNRWSGRWRR